MSGQDWRIGTDATDYFRNEQKRVALDQRRPVIRKGADLVGPGIGSSATKITDYNDPLATFNGYFASEPGALYAPNETDQFVGITIMDETLGGKQVFTSLVSGNEYTRIFLRSPGDEETISFGPWRTEESVPATAFSEFAVLGSNTVATSVPDGASTRLLMPKMAFVGDSDTYARSTTALAIQRPGMYTGYFSVTSPSNILISVVVEFPNGDAQATDTFQGADAVLGVTAPLHFYASNGAGFVRVTVNQISDAPITVNFKRLHLTRIGEAPSV